MVAASRFGPAKTCHGFPGNPGQRIDWAMSRGFRAGAGHSIIPHEGARYPFDHCPVVAGFDG